MMLEIGQRRPQRYPRPGIPERNRQIMEVIFEHQYTLDSVSETAGYSTTPLDDISAGKVKSEQVYIDFETVLGIHRSL